MVVIVFGLPGSGKSYFASRLAQMLQMDYANSDRIRKRMFKQRTYSESETRAVYRRLKMQMRKAVKNGKSLVIDATFHKNDIRQEFINESGEKGTIVFIEVTAPEPIIMERLQQPRLYSEADFGVYKKLTEEWESVAQEHLILKSSNNNIQEMLITATDYLDNNDKGSNRRAPLKRNIPR